MPSAAPRHDPARLGRTSLVIALAYLAVGSLLLAHRGPTLATLQTVGLLLALGAFSPLIFGTARMLLAGLARRPLAGTPTQATAILAALTLGAAAPLLPPGGPAAALASLWALGMAGHVLLTLRTVRAPRRDTASRNPEDVRRDRLVGPLHGAALLHGALGAVLLPFALLGTVATAPVLHLILLGFVTLTVFGVAAHILPRFTDAHYPYPALLVGAPTASLGPLLVAAGLLWSTQLLVLGAALAATGLLSLALGALVLLARAERRRSTLLAYGAGAASIVTGALLGSLLASGYAWPRILPLHATLNLLGFVGLFVLGASADLYAPSILRGRDPLLWHTRTVLAAAIAGLLVAATAIVLNLPQLARGGYVLYAGAVTLHLAGAIMTHVRMSPRLGSQRIQVRNGA